MTETTLNLAVDEVDVVVAPYFTGRESDLDLDAIADEVRAAVETTIEKTLDPEETGEVTVTWNVDGLTAHVPAATQITQHDLEAAWETATGPVEAGGVDLDAIANRHHSSADEDIEAASVAQLAKQGFPQPAVTHTLTAQPASTATARTNASRSSGPDR